MLMETVQNGCILLRPLQVTRQRRRYDHNPLGRSCSSSHSRPCETRNDSRSSLAWLKAGVRGIAPITCPKSAVTRIPSCVVPYSYSDVLLVTIPHAESLDSFGTTFGRLCSTYLYYHRPRGVRPIAYSWKDFPSRPSKRTRQQQDGVRYIFASE